MTNQNTSAVELRKEESYKIFDQVAKTYDRLNHILSFGIDYWWRRQLLKELPKAKDSTLVAIDLACGTADVTIALAKDEKTAKVTGVDLSKEMIAIGQQKINRLAKNHAKKAQLIIGDGMNIPCADDSCDVVSLAFGIRNFSDYKKSLRDIARVLKPGGRALILEFSMPSNFLVKSVYLFYFRHILPKIGNWFSSHADAYSYLNQSVELFPYGQDFLQAMNEAGLVNLRLKKMTFGSATLYLGEAPHDL